MTILKGEKYIIETLSQFRNRLDVTWTEIAESMGEEVQEEMIAEVEEYADDFGVEPPVPLEDVPKDAIRGMVDYHGLNNTIIDVLEARDDLYTHIYDGTVHTIIDVHDIQPD